MRRLSAPSLLDTLRVAPCHTSRRPNIRVYPLNPQLLQTLTQASHCTACHKPARCHLECGCLSSCCILQDTIRQDAEAHSKTLCMLTCSLPPTWARALCRRPLKLTGWELWLCGASNGPLFASDMNATAFDGSEVVPEVRQSVLR
jgi:hypothetical protein